MDDLYSVSRIHISLLITTFNTAANMQVFFQVSATQETVHAVSDSKFMMAVSIKTTLKFNFSIVTEIISAHIESVTNTSPLNILKDIGGEVMDMRHNTFMVGGIIGIMHIPGIGVSFLHTSQNVAG